MKVMPRCSICGEPMKFERYSGDDTDANNTVIFLCENCDKKRRRMLEKQDEIVTEIMAELRTE